MTKKLEDYSKEELIDAVKHLKRRKKFGLVWEEKPEDVVLQCKNELPVLEEVAKLAINKTAESGTNIIIEGDNYHALSVLNYTHSGKIDLIYIDPPYNTGNASWRYNNKIVDAEDSFKHSKFASFLEHRLRLAKNLLSRKGIIVLTIDDYEIHTCRLLLDEIFGEKNRLGTVVIVQNPRGRNDDRYFATMHEYALFYSKNTSEAEITKFEFSDESLAKQFPHKDDISRYGTVSFMRTGNNSDRKTRPNLFYSLYWDGKALSIDKSKNSIEILPVNEKGEEKTWRWSKDTFTERYKTEIEVKEVKGKARLFKKRRPEIVGGTKPKTIWYDPRYDASSHGVVLLDKMFDRRGVFPYPKSLYAVLDTLRIASKKSSIVLDFFAGSGTTGHAVLALNKEDGGDRKFILCTNNENEIAREVTYPRMKKVINGYDSAKGIPANLRYFKTSFVAKSRVSDDTRYQLIHRSADMICVREGTYTKIVDKPKYKIFRDSRHYTAILYDIDHIDALKEKLKRLENIPVHLYVFSITNDSYENDFEEIVQPHKLCPIPESILEVYRRVFREKKWN